jgi:glycosyltransferase involved in cell wall biosynthesis
LGIKKKIGLFLNSIPSEGGVFQYSRSLLEAMASLPQESFELRTAYTSQDWAKVLAGYPMQTLQFRHALWKYASGRLFCSFLPVKVWRAFFLHVHSVKTSIIGQHCDLWIFPAQDTWAYLIPVPALGTIHDLMHRYESRFPEVSSRGEYRKRERHFRNTCRWARAILVDSEIGKRQVTESYGVDSARIYVLPFTPPTFPRVELPSDASNPIPRLPSKYFFYPAQFWEHKNHKSLVKAAALLRQETPDLKVVLTGSPKNAYASTTALIEKLHMEKYFQFLGYVPQRCMPELYRRARALIMPTFFGPTNIPPLEAAAVGCPVAVSDIYGMREQMGDAALYFDPSSPSDIAHVMQRLWESDDLCKELSKKALIHSLHCGQDQFNKRFCHILQQILLPHRLGGS